MHPNHFGSCYTNVLIPVKTNLFEVIVGPSEEPIRKFSNKEEELGNLKLPILPIRQSYIRTISVRNFIPQFEQFSAIREIKIDQLKNKKKFIKID